MAARSEVAGRWSVAHMNSPVSGLSDPACSPYSTTVAGMKAYGCRSEKHVPHNAVY